MKLKEYLKEHDELNEYYVDDVKQLLSSLKPKPKTACDLEEYEGYYYLSTDGRVEDAIWDGCAFDTKARDQGNAFWTKEDAEYEKKRREVYTLIKKHSCKFDKAKSMYQSYYDLAQQRIVMIDIYSSKDVGLCFESQEDIQSAIDEVGEADFIKYYLGIEEEEI